MRRRDYTGPEDLRAKQDMVQRTWNERSRLHIGDLAWERPSIPGRENTWQIEALVCPRGDDGYPTARELHQSIGFRPGARSVTYVA